MNLPAGKSRVLCILITVLGALSAAPASAVTLIEDGRARCTIVVSLELITLAQDLQDHLQKMSGATVPIMHDPNRVDPRTVGIYIDTKPLGVGVPGRSIDRQAVWPDGYVIEIIEFDGRTGVFLSSPRGQGIANAVYGLLEDHLGCHWFAPGEIGTHIPRRTTVALEIPGGRDVSKPSFEMRRPSYGTHAIPTTAERRTIVEWAWRNRWGKPVGNAAHAWGHIYRDDDDPDLWVLFNGKRRPSLGLCMSSPKAVDIAADYLIRYFKSRPEQDYWSFCQDDSLKWCECDRCKAMGSNSAARMLILSSRIAEKVTKVYPSKRISIYAYQGTFEPPEEMIQGHSKLIPIIVAGTIHPFRPEVQSPVRRQQERWLKMLPSAWSYDSIAWSNGPWPMFRAFQAQRNFYVRIGYNGDMNNYASRNLGTDTLLWLALRTAWDNRLPVDDLLDLFYTTYFGAAGDDMRAVYERIEQHMAASGVNSTAAGNLPRLYPPSLLDQCLAEIEGARGKVRDDPLILARIGRDVNCLEATRLWLQYWSALGRANETGRAEERESAMKACRAYLDFVAGLDGTLTLGGRYREYAERIRKDLEHTGITFDEPGSYSYLDTMDQGGKTFHAKSRRGFYVGPYGLYLKPGVTGEIVFDVRTTKELRFKRVSMPSAAGLGGYCTALRLALPPGGHNWIDVSLDEGRTWTTLFEDVDTYTRKDAYEMTDVMGGRSDFLLRFRVQNTEQEILAMDSWVLLVTVEAAG